LVPFQGWAAMKGLLEKEEGPWFRTPKTGIITDPVKHLRRLNLVRRWLLGPRAGGYAREPGSVTTRPTPVVQMRARIPSRWIGWIVAGSLLLGFGALAWSATGVPVVHAAVSPLYLHGTGAAPCTASTMDQTVGTRTPAANVCSVQSASGGVTTVWAFTNLPLQTVAAGQWDFTMYWTGPATGNNSDTVTVSVGVSATASCAGFVALVPNPPSTWTTTFGSAGVNTASPFTVSTTTTVPLVIPAGGSLCLQVVLTHNTGTRQSLIYDGTAGLADTRLVPPTSVVPESLIGWLGLAFAIPLLTQRRRVLSFLRSLK